MSDYAQYTSLVNAIYFSDVSDCIDLLLKTCPTTIPVSIFKHAIFSRRLDILGAILSTIRNEQYIVSISPELLLYAVQLNNASIFKTLVVNGCTLTDTPGSKQIVYSLQSHTNHDIIKYVLTTTPPLTINDCHQDLDFLERTITNNQQWFGYFIPDCIIITSPSTLSHLLNISITTRNWIAADWLLTHHMDLLQDEQTCTKHLDMIVSQYCASQDNTVYLSSLTALLKCGARVNFSRSEYIRLVTRYAEDPQFLDALHLIFSQTAVTNPQHGGASSFLASTIHQLLYSAVPPSYALIRLLLGYGVEIPPSMFFIKRLPRTCSNIEMNRLLQTHTSPTFWARLRGSLEDSDTNRSSLGIIIQDALSSGNIELVDMFTQHGFTFPDDCLSQYGDEWDPLEWVDSVEAIQYVMTKWNIPLEKVSSTTLQTPLFSAVLGGSNNTDEVIFMFNKGATFGEISKEYFPLLLQNAVKYDCYSMVECLLGYGYSANQSCDDSYPLHHVKSVEVAMLLIQHQCDVNVYDKYCRTPLCYAYDISIAQLLIDHGAWVNPPSTSIHDPTSPDYFNFYLDNDGHYRDDNDGHYRDDNDDYDYDYDYKTRRSYNYDFDYESIIQDPTRDDHYEFVFRSPLQMAIRRRHWDLAQLLLESKAHINLDHPKCPLATIPMVIGAFNDVEKVHYLFSLGADINHNDIHGYYALRTACHFNNIAIIHLLIANGLSLSSRNNIGCLCTHGLFDIISQSCHKKDIRRWILYEFDDYPGNAVGAIFHYGSPAIQFLQKYGLNFNNQCVIDKIVHCSQVAVKILLDHVDIQLSSHNNDILHPDEDIDTLNDHDAITTPISSYGSKSGYSNRIMYDKYDGGVIHCITSYNWDLAWQLISRGADVTMVWRYKNTLQWAMTMDMSSDIAQFAVRGPLDITFQWQHIARLIPIVGKLGLNPVEEHLECPPPILMALEQDAWYLFAQCIAHGADVMVTTYQNASSTALHLIAKHPVINQFHDNCDDSDCGGGCDGMDSDYQFLTQLPPPSHIMTPGPPLCVLMEAIRLIKQSPTFHPRLLDMTDAHGRKAADYIESRNHPLYSLLASSSDLMDNTCNE